MLVVKKAVDLLRADDDLARLEARLQPFIDGLFMGFTVQDLDWLKMGGRVRALAAFMGGMLNIKPIIRLQDARLIPTDKMRCKKPALKKLVGMAAEKYRQRNGQCHVWLAYSDNLEEAMTTRAKLAARLACPADRINLAEVGATIFGSHRSGCDLHCHVTGLNSGLPPECGRDQAHIDRARRHAG